MWRLSSVMSCALLFSILLRPSEAAFRPHVVSQPAPDGMRVTISGRTVVTVRVGNGELLPLDRAERVVWNLQLFLDGGGAPWQVRPVPVPGAWAVFGGETPLIVATPEDAAALDTRPRNLARAWARAIRAALSLPPLTVSTRQLVIPFGEQRTVTVGGVAAGEIVPAPADAGVVSATAQRWPRAVTLRGQAPGLSAVRLECDGAAITLSVRVKKYAGAPLPAPTAEVTGRPAPGALVREVALVRCPEGLRLEPGACVKLLRSVPLPRALQPGATTELAFPVAIGGEGYLPVRTTVRVRVRNRVLPHRETLTLLYSNNPERIRRPDLLYFGTLHPDAPTRLLYHHQNMSGRPVRLRIDLYNPGDLIAEVQAIEGAAGPSNDTVLVGHRAGVRYLQNSLREVGQIVLVPAGARRSLVVQRLPQGWTASGLFDLRVLSPGSLFVRVAAEPDRPGPEGVAVAAESGPASALAGIPSPERPRPTVSQEVYPSPRKHVEASYTVGQRWAFVNLGRSPLSAKNKDRQLAGNYGVMYDILLRLENPTGEERTVQIFLSPDAGDARGVFLIDGRIVEAPHVTPPAEALLARIKMKPAERRTLSIRTMPVGGSAYPVSLVVRP
jgi:hypothetical protein